MRFLRILSVAALLVSLTSAAAFGHSLGMAWDQQGRELSQKDQSDLAQWEAQVQQFGDFAKKGDYAHGAAAAEKALEIAKQSTYLGSVGGVGVSMCNLAGCYYNQGQYAKAEPLFQSVLEMYQKKLGSDNPTVAALLNNLGSVHERLGHLEKAESLYQRALEIDEKVHGADHPNVAVALKNLAGLYRSMHRDGEAAKLEQRAAAIEAVKR